MVFPEPLTDQIRLATSEGHTVIFYPPSENKREITIELNSPYQCRMCVWDEFNVNPNLPPNKQAANIIEDLRGEISRAKKAGVKNDCNH